MSNSSSRKNCSEDQPRKYQDRSRTPRNEAKGGFWKPDLFNLFHLHLLPINSLFAFRFGCILRCRHFYPHGSTICRNHQESGYEINVRPFVWRMPQITLGLQPLLQIILSWIFVLRLPPGEKVRDQPLGAQGEKCRSHF